MWSNFLSAFKDLNILADLETNFSLERWTWAWGAVCTRSLDIAENDLSLVPFVDFLNHEDVDVSFNLYPAHPPLNNHYEKQPT